MTQWTPKLEALIREIGEYSETQMKDLLNPKSSARATSLRILFRHATQGKNLMKQTSEEAGIAFNGQNWMDSLQQLIDIAEKNNSTAAEKIKKAMPISQKLTTDFKQQKSGGMIEKIKFAKQQKIQY